MQDYKIQASASNQQLTASYIGFIGFYRGYFSEQQLMQMNPSVWSMYQHADIVVKIVMIGLLLASVVT